MQRWDVVRKCFTCVAKMECILFPLLSSPALQGVCNAQGHLQLVCTVHLHYPDLCTQVGPVPWPWIHLQHLYTTGFGGYCIVACNHRKWTVISYACKLMERFIVQMFSFFCHRKMATDVFQTLTHDKLYVWFTPHVYEFIPSITYPINIYPV